MTPTMALGDAGQQIHHHQIHYQQIHKFFQRRHLLNDLSVSLQGGHATLLCGDNGSGKTTLLRILCGLEKPTQCGVIFGDNADQSQENAQKWSKCRHRLQQQVMYLHQQPYMFDGTVLRNLALALPLRMAIHKRKNAVRSALQWAQLEGFAEQRAKTLSSGEKQRISLARAWLCRSPILLLDEPTANMDKLAQNLTIAMLKKLKQSGSALLIASHEHAAFDEIIDSRLTLAGGKLT